MSEISESASTGSSSVSDSVLPSSSGMELQTDGVKSPSYVKLAMRNMVKKRGTSLYHFALTTVGLVLVLVGLAYLTR
jgi:Protein of unknown function (DUF3285)